MFHPGPHRIEGHKHQHNNHVHTSNISMRGWEGPVLAKQDVSRHDMVSIQEPQRGKVPAEYPNIANCSVALKQAVP